MGATAGHAGSTAVGPDELLPSLLDVARVLAELPAMASRGDRDGWSEVIRSCQQILNAATAVQDDAVVRLVAIEPFVLDDGTVAESHRAPGHVALDGPALVASALEVSQVHADRRVRGAVRLAADGPAGTTTCTGLGGLHDAMREGTLDAYRASVVADELEEAPPEVAETVVASLAEDLHRETAPQLRRRCRRLLARISPDLLRRRATRAREECGLRRWVGEPGVDRWEASFPSEDAARAWAAIDARAQQLVADGTFQRVDRARAQALIDLVTDNAVITTVITLAVPAASPVRGPLAVAPAPVVPVQPAAEVRGPGAVSALVEAAAEARGPGAGDAFVEVATGRGSERVLVPTAWVEAQLTAPEVTVEVRPCDAATGALLHDGSTDAYRPPEELTRLVRQRDSRCRFPGCSIAARFCDLDHVRPWPAGPTAADNLVCLCRRHHRVKQRPGWRVVLAPDGRVTWTEPTGRVRTTLPLDALHALTLPALTLPALPSVPSLPSRRAHVPDTDTDTDTDTDRGRPPPTPGRRRAAEVWGTAPSAGRSSSSSTRSATRQQATASAPAVATAHAGRRTST